MVLIVGTGPIEFHCLLKEGPPNVGEFWWPNDLMLEEAAPSGERNVVGATDAQAGLSCDDVCASQNMLCVEERLDDVDSRATFNALVTPFHGTCVMPELTACDSAVGMHATGDNKCFYADANGCQGKTIVAPTCAAKQTDTKRICTCKQDPSKPVIKVTAPTTTLPRTTAPIAGTNTLYSPKCSNGDALCKCSSDNDCKSGTCLSGVCKPSLCLYQDIGCPCNPVDQTCNFDYECKEGVCAVANGGDSCRNRLGEVGCFCTDAVRRVPFFV